METQVIISKKQYDYYIKLDEQLKKFKKDNRLCVGSISENDYGHIKIGYLNILVETEVIKVLLQRINDMQSRIDEIAKERDGCYNRLHKKRKFLNWFCIK